MSEVPTFFKADMPATRVADYQLGYLGGSVFIDFNRSSDGLIYLKRISFDGYGCCTLNTSVKALNAEESEEFISAFRNDPMDNEKLKVLLQKSISLNSEQIWADALKQYDLTGL